MTIFLADSVTSMFVYSHATFYLSTVMVSSSFFDSSLNGRDQSEREYRNETSKQFTFGSEMPP